MTIPSNKSVLYGHYFLLICLSRLGLLRDMLATRTYIPGKYGRPIKIKNTVYSSTVS